MEPFSDIPAQQRADKVAERASSAEMKFAGYFLNLGGITLLLVGLVSYIKAAAQSDITLLPGGTVELGLGAGLGLVLLVAGEYLYRREMEQFSHPIVTGGFCLLFFVVCSAHFRHGLIGSSVFFALLLMVVAASNASVFRFDSKMIGNAMSLVYFTAPLVLAFSFEHFSGLFLYLLSINGGTALVAWRKKWDFQLVVACVGSYSFFYLHGNEGSPAQVIALLLLIYTLSFIANNTIFFTRPEGSSFNLVVSFVNPVSFAAFSSTAVLFHFSNWVPVSVYLTLASGHAAVAWAADRRRAESGDFRQLATNNLLMSLLFLCAAISFVTYFADDTSYFTLVTLLWFGLAHALLQLGLWVPRHRDLAARFSAFSLALASFQVYYVVSSMGSALLLKASSAVLLVGYFAIMFWYKESLSDEQLQFLQACLFVAVPASGALLTFVPVLAVPALLAAGFAVVRCSFRYEAVGFLRWSGHALLGLAFYEALPVWPDNPSWPLLPLATLLYGAVLYRIRASQEEWVWFGLLAGKCCALSGYHSAGMLLLSVAATQALFAGLGVFSGHERLFRGFFVLTSIPLVMMALSATSLPLLGAAGVISLGSLALARRWEEELEGGHYGSAVAIFAKLFVLLLLPYPLVGLVMVAAGAAVCMKFGHVSASLLLSASAALGLALAPLSHWMDGWSLTAFTLTIGLTGYTYRLARDAFALYALNRMEALASLLLFRWSLDLVYSPLSTLLWVVLAAVLLRDKEERRDWNLLGQGAFDAARLLLFAAFLKAVVYDANFVTTATPLHFPLSFAVAASFLVIAHALVRKREARNGLMIAGLLVFCFQTTFLLHRLWGHLDLFQPLLSGFWSFTAFGIIAAGVVLQVKAYRLFGLSTMVGSALKVLWVDIHVLDAYSQTNTYLILGTLLVSTSLLYQKQRSRLTGEPRPVSAPPVLDLG